MNTQHHENQMPDANAQRVLYLLALALEEARNLELIFDRIAEECARDLAAETCRALRARK